ncbi:multidrug efflux SMR transporter [Sporosarcina sp. Te-1]|uniref:DMT family transporter n=1 Tax=Sporosarcina sp. Te-1 TaxID=2818390 RepID=UPI001A9F2C3D|nr:multidrug efflux SMR transporter [Sporosarcina sp. Te-1]QTD43067.1 multidrug efflux SMR transporter [Sporosarcina sp. Te-1]
MAWLYVVFAAIVEIFWVVGLRYSDSLLEWAGTVVAILFSFYFIIQACEKLPSGTVYAVFTGSGAAAIVLIDFVLFHAEFSYVKILCIGMIIIGVIGIKVTTIEVQQPETEGSEE